MFVPESMSIDDLLHEFQRRKVHIAIVLDEYGGTAGLVTIEDLLEEIVGRDPGRVRRGGAARREALRRRGVRVDGRAAVDDLGELFDIELELEDEEEYDTVGGLVYHRIGGVPEPGDEVDARGPALTVETTDGRRVGKVLVVRDAPATAERTTTTADGRRRRARRPRRRRRAAIYALMTPDDDALAAARAPPARRRQPRPAPRGTRRGGAAPPRA